jgi:hypothetical protein
MVMGNYLRTFSLTIFLDIAADGSMIMTCLYSSGVKEPGLWRIRVYSYFTDIVEQCAPMQVFQNSSGERLISLPIAKRYFSNPLGMFDSEGGI